MSTRPRSITVLAWIFIAVGCTGLVRAARPLVHALGAGLLARQELQDAGIVAASGFLALLGGALILRASNWGRWLLVAWMAFHVIVSVLHPPLELVVHGVIFAGLLYVFFRPSAMAYFRRGRGGRSTTAAARSGI